MSAFTEHPVLKEMMEYKSKNEVQTMLAYTTYMQFCEGKYVMWNVDHMFLSSLNLIVIKASKKNTSDVEVHLPISSQMEISPEWMQQVNKDVEKLMGISKVKILLCEGDSKFVGYTIQEGLQSETTETELCKQISNSKQLSFVKEKLLQKYAHDIYEEAKKKSECNDIEKTDDNQTDVLGKEKTAGDNINQDLINTEHGEKEEEDKDSKKGNTSQNEVPAENVPSTKNQGNEITKDTLQVEDQCGQNKNDKETNEEVRDDKVAKKKENVDENSKEANIDHVVFEKEKAIDHALVEDTLKDTNSEGKIENKDELVSTVIENIGLKIIQDGDNAKKQVNKVDGKEYSKTELVNEEELTNEKKNNEPVMDTNTEDEFEMKEKKENDKDKQNELVVNENKLKCNENVQKEHEKGTVQKQNEGTFDNQNENDDYKEIVEKEESGPSQLSGNRNQCHSKNQEKKTNKKSPRKEKEVNRKQNQVVVDIISSTEDETSGDDDDGNDSENENDSDNESKNDSEEDESGSGDDDDDSSDVIEVSDDSDHETLTKKSKIKSNKTSQTKSQSSETDASSSSNSDIEEIEVIKTAPPLKKRNICNKHPNQKKRDDLEVLYEVDDRKSFFASQIVEVVYSNSLDDADCNENTSGNYCESTEDAVEIVFEKEGKSRNKQKKRQNNSFNEINHFSNKKKRFPEY